MGTQLWDPSPAAAVARRRRQLFMVGGVLSALAVGLLATVLFVSPATFGRALGLATEVPALVTDVRPATQQPTRDDADPTWTLTLQWADPRDGIHRTASATVSAAPGTFRIGQSDSVFVWWGDDVAFNDENPSGIWTGLAGAVVLSALGVAFVRRAAPWKVLLDAVDGSRPQRVRVTAFSGAGGPQWRPLIDWTPSDGVGPGAVLRVYPQPPFVYPRVGEELELHSLRDDHRGPLLFRRLADDVWWCGRHRPGLEPVDP